MTTIETKEKQVINITNIVFDDKLKEFIMKTKERFDLSGLALMSSKTIDDVLELQEELREYFVNNQYENMLTKNKKLRLNTNNPDFYALFLLLISNVSDYDNWKNVMILIKHQLEPTDYEKYNHATNVSFHCACGKLLTSGDMYKIYNIETKMMVWLGNSCFLKDKIASPQDLKKIKREKISKQERAKEEIRQKLREKLIQEINKQLQEISEMGKEDQLLIQKEKRKYQIIKIKRNKFYDIKWELFAYNKCKIYITTKILNMFYNTISFKNENGGIMFTYAKLIKIPSQLLIENENNNVELEIKETHDCKCGLMKENTCMCGNTKFKLVILSNNLYRACVDCNKYKCRC